MRLLHYSLANSTFGFKVCPSTRQCRRSVNRVISNARQRPTNIYAPASVQKYCGAANDAKYHMWIFVLSGVADYKVLFRQLAVLVPKLEFPHAGHDLPLVLEGVARINYVADDLFSHDFCVTESSSSFRIVEPLLWIDIHDPDRHLYTRRRTDDDVLDSTTPI